MVDLSAGDDKNDVAFKALKKLRLRLLDLSAHNRLINFRHTKKGNLRIIDELPDQLVEKMLTDKELHFLPVQEPTLEDQVALGYLKIEKVTEKQQDRLGKQVWLKEKPTAQQWAEHLGLKTAYEVPKPAEKTVAEKHLDDSIQVLLSPDELEEQLKTLMQTAESAIQEVGANILYLAFGFLEWYEYKDKKNNNRARLAPLFLLPVRLQKGRLNKQTKTYEYTISYSGEDILPNLSLREKLRTDFALALPSLDENTNPEAYFEEVQVLIKENQPRWRLRRFITLTLLNFSKLLMYLDLDPACWPQGSGLLNHPVVMEFLSGYKTEQGEEGSGRGDLGFGEEYQIDDIEDVHAKYPLIDDADSSQHSALIDAINGKNLVIEGPPGTGKSQTITNLIAAAMARGKRVLFVAEKLAALEVVSRRLDAIGLGEFCLELHSHKSQKRKVLDEVGDRLNKHGHYRLPQNIDVDILRYEELKIALKGHAERINQPWKSTGKTLQEIFMAATRYREMLDCNPEILHPEGYDGDSLDALAQQRLEDLAKSFHKVYQDVVKQLDGVDKLQHHPWYGVRNADLQIFDLDRVQSALEDWQHTLRNLNKERIELAKALGAEPNEITNSLNGLSVLLEDLGSLPALKGDEFLESLPLLRGKILEKSKQYLIFFEAVQSRYAVLAEVVTADILKDFSEVDRFVVGQQQLSRLVGQSVELGVVAKSIKSLKIIDEQLTKIDKILEKIRAAVGKEAADHLLSTVSGFAEFIILIDLVSDLNSSYWRLRDERFDNEEMDDLLPKMCNEIELLRVLHDDLNNVFHLDTLPAQETLREIRVALDTGGLFRWFKGNWRTVRKQALDLAASSQISFTLLYSLLGKAEEYSERCKALAENTYYKRVFGNHLKGLETDLVALEALRDWYKKVRQQYGVGFTQKAALGSAVLELPLEIIRAAHSLSDQGMQRQLNNFLEELLNIKKVFSPVSGLQNDKTLLVGNKGILSRLLAALNKALLSCKPLLTDNAVSIVDLAHRIELFVSLKKAVGKLEAADYDNKLFQGSLGLQLGVDVDNSSALSMLRNTLVVAEIVDQQLPNVIQQRIYAQPEASTFEILLALLEKLRKALDFQAEKYSDVEHITKLDSDAWMKLSGDNLDALLCRNDQALRNGQSLQNWLDYVRVRNQVKAMGLGRLATLVEQGNIEIQQVYEAHKAGLFDLLAREIFREQPEWGHFSGRTQETLQEHFRTYDNRLKKLQCEKIAWHLNPAMNISGSAERIF